MVYYSRRQCSNPASSRTVVERVLNTISSAPDDHKILRAYVVLRESDPVSRVGAGGYRALTRRRARARGSTPSSQLKHDNGKMMDGIEGSDRGSRKRFARLGRPTTERDEAGKFIRYLRPPRRVPHQWPVGKQVFICTAVAQRSFAIRLGPNSVGRRDQRFHVN